MLNFIVLGYIPGTSTQISFELFALMVELSCLFLLSILFFRLYFGRKFIEKFSLQFIR